MSFEANLERVESRQRELEAILSSSKGLTAEEITKISKELFELTPIAEKVLELLKNYDIRGFVDDRNEKIGKKIRESELNKIPFMLVVGEKEADNKEVAVRQRLEGDQGSMSIKAFADLVLETIEVELTTNA